jgi:hypothetical protein
VSKGTIIVRGGHRFGAVDPHHEWDVELYGAIFPGTIVNISVPMQVPEGSTEEGRPLAFVCRVVSLVANLLPNDHASRRQYPSNYNVVADVIRRIDEEDDYVRPS